MHRLKQTAIVAWLGILGFVITPGCGPTQYDSPQTVAANPQDPPAPILPPAQRATSDLCKSGAKLRDNNDAQKIITGAPGVLLDVKSGAVLELQIPPAIQHFKATHGRVPKNHAEFVSGVLELNNLQLPQLIDGMVYQFNPEKEELWAYPKDQLPPEK